MSSSTHHQHWWKYTSPLYQIVESILSDQFWRIGGLGSFLHSISAAHCLHERRMQWTRDALFMAPPRGAQNNRWDFMKFTDTQNVTLWHTRIDYYGIKWHYRTLSTNDLPSVIQNIYASRFADDTAIYNLSKDSIELQLLLQDGLHSLEYIYKQWVINVKKTKDMKNRCCALLTFCFA